MATSGVGETTFQESIEEVDAMKRGPQRKRDDISRTTTDKTFHSSRRYYRPEWTLPFFVDTFEAKCTKPKASDINGDAVAGVHRKIILRDVSADFPVGILTAVLGVAGAERYPLSAYEGIGYCKKSPQARVRSDSDQGRRLHGNGMASDNNNWSSSRNASDQSNRGAGEPRFEMLNLSGETVD